MLRTHTQPYTRSLRPNKLKVITDSPKPAWWALASPESLPCCSVQVCRQVSSPVSLWSSGRGSWTWWSCWRRRVTSPHSSRCSSASADICHILYAPGVKIPREGLKFHI